MKKTMLILIILTSLLPGVLAIVQYFDNQKKEIESNKSAQALNLKIDSLKLDNSELNTQLQNLLVDNVKLSHQLSETALRLNENVIGNGDLDIELNTTKTTKFNFRFVNNSDLPVNNTHIVIQNYSEIMKCGVIKETDNQVHIKNDCYKDNYSKLSGININPHNAFLDSENIHLFTGGYMNYVIRIATRNKTTFHHLVYKIVNGEVKRSYRNYKLVNEKLVFVEENNSLDLPKDYWSKNFYTKILYTQ
jgi:hypothetical protein